MKHIMAAVAALALLTASAGAFAQTKTDCAPASKGAAGQAQGSGAAPGEAPGASTCEKVVMPNGSTQTQNGPAADAAGAPTANHEGTGSSAK